MREGPKIFVFLLVLTLFLSGCTTYTTRVENAPGRSTVYQDPGTTSATAGVGLESQDIISMCDKMMRDMMSNPLLANQATPPQVVIDASNFTNESANRINLNMITDRVRSGLLRAANGRMIFVGRHGATMVEKERRLKREGIVDAGTTGMTTKTLGGDYRLWGRITDLNSMSNSTGQQTRFSQIIFEMMDLETGGIVWGGEYSFRKSAADDIIYY